MPIIELEKVNFSYGDHPVLENVSLAVEEGDYLGVIGPNGSGKTTLLRLMLGLIQPVEGELKIFDQKPAQLKDRWQIGYVPQRITQADWQFPATVQEVVESGRVAKLGLGKMLTAEDRKAVSNAMSHAGVTKNKDRLIGQLSGGERQRVFIARALASQPKILFLDEPTVGVDIASQEDFYTLLCELNSKHNLTIVLVSHDVDVISQEVKTVLFLNRKVIGYGKAKEMMQDKYLEKLYGDRVKFITHHH